VSRDLPAPLEADIEQPVVRPFLAMLIDLPDPVYVWTGVGTLTFNDGSGVSRNWIGAGAIGAIDSIGEATDGGATGIKATLFQIPAEFRDDIADQAVRGVNMELHVGSLNTDFQTIVATKLIWKGRLDQYKITDGGDTLSVEVVGESRAIDQRRPAIKRFSDEYQQRKFPGDLFFQYVSQMTEVPILWAKAEQSGTTVTGGGGSGGGGGLEDRMNIRLV